MENIREVIAVLGMSIVIGYCGYLVAKSLRL